eukprot:gene18258-23933_t
MQSSESTPVSPIEKSPEDINKTPNSQRNNITNSHRNASHVSLSSLSNESVSSRRRCMYFIQGTCRNGDQCRFVHDYQSNSSPQTIPSGPTSGYNTPPIALMPSPIIVNIPPGIPIFSIDVECVATAVQHNARSVAQVALVDEWSRPVFNVLIKQDVPVVSYLTPLTGLTKEAIDQFGLPLADAMALLRAHLPSNAILVGQNILKDVQWLQLIEGVDYMSLIDLATLFRVWDPSKNDFITFSQDHSASVWLGMPQRPHHDALTDAAISVNLFNAYRSIQYDTQRLIQMQRATLTAPRIPGFSSLYPVLDGCCMGNRKKCICGTPFT